MTLGVIDEGNNVPEPVLPEEELVFEKKLAKFAKSDNFKILKEHLESRKRFYQRFLPGGMAIADATNEERGWRWLAANTIIEELDTIIFTYESAAEAVRDAGE